MIKLVLTITTTTLILFLGIFIGCAWTSGKEIDSLDIELGEARYQETIARGRLQTLERDLRLCKSESVHITVVTSKKAKGVYLKVMRRRGE